MPAIAQVEPLTTARALHGPFDYLAPPNAAVGQLLVVPFGRREITGVVVGLADTSQIERFFAERFHRALPVSARGQTPAHDRLGFDHRNALDVAVHPDTAEGQALMAWLRTHGVSFVGFRGPIAGEATGAHLHVGAPSPRRAPRAG